MDNLNLIGSVASIMSLSISVGIILWSFITKTKVSRFNLMMLGIFVMNVMSVGICLWVGEILAAMIAGIAFMLILLYWLVRFIVEEVQRFFIDLLEVLEEIIIELGLEDEKLDERLKRLWEKIE